jgi:ribonuclease T1
LSSRCSWQLPPQQHGYYREYTVRTPGARDRGARRIVAGAGGEYYYSADHYRSFKRIRE